MLSIILLNVTHKPVMLSIILLNVTYKPFMLSIIMLNAVMLSVVKPFLTLVRA
jgi:hypothetical protein